NPWRIFVSFVSWRFQSNAVTRAEMGIRSAAEGGEGDAGDLEPARVGFEGDELRPQDMRLLVVEEPGRLRFDDERSARDRLFDPLEHEGVVHEAEAALDVVEGGARMAAPGRAD